MRLLRRGVIPLRGAVPKPTPREVLRALGVPHAQRIEDIEEKGVREAIKLAQERALAMATFEGVFRTANAQADPTSGRLTVEGASPDLLAGEAAQRRFSGARLLVLSVVTLGEQWDEALDELATRGEPAEAWFLDALGTWLVDRAARLVEERAGREIARLGLERMGRYRPGYGDLPLEAQAELCALCESERIGVQANEAMSLWPRKSVTGLAAFREKAGEAGERGEEDEGRSSSH